MPEVSALLKRTKTDRGPERWLTSIAEVSALLNAITYITHREMFAAGLHCLLAMQHLPEVQDVLQIWPSVYNALSVISNRSSLRHRDNGSRVNCFDLLATIGGDPTQIMDWPLFKTTISYTSGTVALFSGSSIPHAVHSSKADRVCFAFYMKEDIRRWCKIEVPNRLSYGTYLHVNHTL